MKNSIFTSLVVAAMVAAGCATTHSGGGYGYVDDIYYNPRTDQQSTQKDLFTERATLDKETQKASDKELAQMQRNYSQQTPNQNTDFEAVQQKYANILANDSIADTDTLVYSNDETGYWVDGFDGSNMDRDYAERIVRFHGPFTGVPYWSPLYTELVYSNSWDWNVYVDGSYAWAFPTWSNPWYYNSYYSSPGWSLSFGWGWPYYSGWNWGLGYYSSWHNPYYYNNYWGHPYYGHHGGYHHYPSHHYNEGQTYSNETPHRGNATNHSYTPSNTNNSYNRTSQGNNSNTTRRSDEQGNTVISNGQQTYTRPSRDSYQQYSGTEKSISTTNSSQQTNDRATRRSYTPTYSQPQSSSRPTYNRTESPNQNTAPRSSGSVNSASPSRSTPASTGARYHSSGGNNQPSSSGNNTYTRPARSESNSSPSYSAPSRSSGNAGGGGGMRTGSPSSGGSNSGGSNPRSNRR